MAAIPWRPVTWRPSAASPTRIRSPSTPLDPLATLDHLTFPLSRPLSRFRRHPKHPPPWPPSPSRPSSSLAPGSVTFCFIYDDYFACEEQIDRSHARDRPQLRLRPRSSATSTHPPRPSAGLFELSLGTAVSSSLDPPLFPIAIIATDRRTIPCRKPRLPWTSGRERLCPAAPPRAPRPPYGRPGQPAHCPRPAPPLAVAVLCRRPRVHTRSRPAAPAVAAALLLYLLPFLFSMPG